MKLSALLALLLSVTFPARADNDIRLLQGAGYPICRAVASALRRMPPDTGLLSWVGKLPPIRGVTKPNWERVPPGAAPDQVGSYEPAWWPSNEKITAVEQTTLWDVHLEGQPRTDKPGRWFKEFRLIRYGHMEQLPGLISNASAKHTKPSIWWVYEAENIMGDEPPEVLPIGGRTSEFDVLLSDGQPWFVSQGAFVESLIWTTVTAGQEGITTDSRCFLRFPNLFPRNLGR